MADYYAHVVGGEIKKLNIPRASTFKNVAFGKNSTDAEHIAVGLLPIVGVAPSYDPATQRRIGPTYVVNNNQVDRVYSLEHLSQQELSDAQEERDGGVRREVIRQEILGDPEISAILKMTSSEISAHFSTKTTLPEIRDSLGKMAKLLAVLMEGRG